MANTSGKKGKSFFEKLAEKVTKATGSTPVILLAFLVVIVWAASGPIFDYSETWQLVINTGTTIITFLMVFLIQKSQNRDSLAIQIKLNELLASHELASNRIVDIEDISEDEMEVLEKYYRKLAALAAKARSLQESHSLDEAQMHHDLKAAKGKRQEAKVENTKSQAPNSKSQPSHAKAAASKSEHPIAKSPAPKGKSQASNSKSQTSKGGTQSSKPSTRNSK